MGKVKKRRRTASAKTDHSRPSAAEQRERGDKSEARMLASLRSPHASLPHWFLGVREATADEDLFGHVDAWIQTKDAGEIRVQIKSSYYGAVTFLKKFPHLVPDTVLVIVYPADSFGYIRHTILYEASRIRAQRLGKPVPPERGNQREPRLRTAEVQYRPSRT